MGLMEQKWSEMPKQLLATLLDLIFPFLKIEVNFT